MFGDEDGGLVVGSGMGSAVVRPSRSASKKPSKNRSERMASGGASIFEGKSAEEAEGSSGVNPFYRTGRKVNFRSIVCKLLQTQQEGDIRGSNEVSSHYTLFL